MAEYCQGCSTKVFGDDLEELAGMISPALFSEGYGLFTVCEGCGPVVVDHNGRRVEVANLNG
ncbi:MAG: hypothetical protein H3C38_17430 [Rhodospirillales bacterium]|nr:hypothetical protein [Rhodospirillales bacterium]